MPESKDLVINEFQKGIADSPHLGFQDMRNLDIHSVPGAVRVNFRTDLAYAGVTELPKWFVPNPATGALYALDGSGKLYSNVSGSWALYAGNTLTNAHGNGLAIWKDYVFVARDAHIDVYGPLSGTPAWTNGWKTFSGAEQDIHFHPMIAGQDDILYGGAGRYLFSVSETSGDTFDPADSASFNFNPQALDLKSGVRVKCLAELGTKIMAGTIKGPNSYGGVWGADIYPWDRVSPSFNMPITLNEFGIHQMQTINNVLYITAGLYPTIYKTNGSTTLKLRKIPVSVLNTEGTFSLNPGACSVFENRYIFGVSRGALSTATGIGVYSITPEGVLVFDRQISTGTTSSSNALEIGALYSSGSNITIGWQDNTTSGIDTTSTSNRYGSYAAYFISPLIQVGTRLQREAFQQIEFRCDRLFSSGHGIRLSQRKNLSDTFTVIGTYTTTGELSANLPAGITDAEFVQIKCEITDTTATPIALREVRLIKPK